MMDLWAEKCPYQPNLKNRFNLDLGCAEPINANTNKLIIGWGECTNSGKPIIQVTKLSKERWEKLNIKLLARTFDGPLSFWWVKPAQFNWLAKITYRRLHWNTIETNLHAEINLDLLCYFASNRLASPCIIWYPAIVFGAYFSIKD